MTLSRRRFILAVGTAAVPAVSFAGCSAKPDRGSRQQKSPAGEIGLVWWGNPTRDANTTKAVAAYMATNPAVEIDAQSIDYGAYWSSLDTHFSDGTAPDVIQMDVGYISEYADRGDLLDLDENGVDTSTFAATAVELGKVHDTRVGAAAGINTPAICVNPDILENAKVNLPDDTTWTWELLMELSAEVAAKIDVVGITSFFSQVWVLEAFLRQHGRSAFSAQGIGFDSSDAQAFFDLMLKYQRSGAIPSSTKVAEESSKPLEHSAFAASKAAFTGGVTSNQISAVNDAAGVRTKILRWPSLTGKATERAAWYGSPVLWSASAHTTNPSAAVSLINWFLNSRDSNDIELAERGLPANTEILAHITPRLSEAQREIAQFLADIKPEIGAPPIPAPPGGGSLASVMFQHELDVLSGRRSAGDAAKAFVSEVKSALQG